LKFAYLGKRYNGFEHHNNNKTPLPTIEEELWKALYKCKLIFPTDVEAAERGEITWDGCDYSKCGRTDKGVSAFGQVIGVRVRSNRRPRKPKPSSAPQDLQESPRRSSVLAEGNGHQRGEQTVSGSVEQAGSEELAIDEEDGDSFDPINDEINYPAVLNHILPPDIRILAWCPSPPDDFSARFSCRERRYKYFFTQPAFCPFPENLGSNARTKGLKAGWLDIQAMRDAASRYVGVHDFRNYCKIDASKQITNFMRRIYYADIVEEDAVSTLGYVNQPEFVPAPGKTSSGATESAPNPTVYSFTLHGSAFLWHQVRHMVAMLFLVGQGLESPSMISDLLDLEKYPSRPTYEMADDAPLVLWDCVFPSEDDEDRKDALQWLYVGDSEGYGADKYGSQGLMKDLWEIWRESKIDEVLAGTLLSAVARQGKDPKSLTSTSQKAFRSQQVFRGGNAPSLQGTYVPLAKKPRLELVEEINQKYALRKGLVPKEVSISNGLPGKEEDLIDE
jgi:tRNA pseudouridine38/39 synthase